MMTFRKVLFVVTAFSGLLLGGLLLSAADLATEGDLPGVTLGMEEKNLSKARSIKPLSFGGDSNDLFYERDINWPFASHVIYGFRDSKLLWTCMTSSVGAEQIEKRAGEYVSYCLKSWGKEYKVGVVETSSGPGTYKAIMMSWEDARSVRSATFPLTSLSSVPGVYEIVTRRWLKTFDLEEKIQFVEVPVDQFKSVLGVLLELDPDALNKIRVVPTTNKVPSTQPASRVQTRVGPIVEKGVPSFLKWEREKGTFLFKKIGMSPFPPPGCVWISTGCGTGPLFFILLWNQELRSYNGQYSGYPPGRIF